MYSAALDDVREDREDERAEDEDDGGRGGRGEVAVTASAKSIVAMSSPLLTGMPQLEQKRTLSASPAPHEIQLAIAATG